MTFGSEETSGYSKQMLDTTRTLYYRERDETSTNLAKRVPAPSSEQIVKTAVSAMMWTDAPPDLH